MRIATMLAAAAVLFMSRPAFAEDSAWFDYIVAPGDTCIGIAVKMYGDRDDFRIIHKHNRDLGPSPHNLEVGTILRLVRKSGEPDATLTKKRGSVQVQPPSSSWNSAKPGMDLFRAWRVSSEDSASAEITFTDQSKVQMRENTVVIIYGATKGNARRTTTEAHLENGSLRTRMSDLDGGELVVTSDSAETRLSEGGDVLVTVDADGTSRVANHEGAKVTVRQKKTKKSGKRRKVKVATGMGTKVEKNKAPTKPRPLPPSPVWDTSPDVFVGWSGQGGTISGTWQPEPKAHQYRVDIARDEHGADVAATVTTSGEVTRFEAHGLPSGTYHVFVSSIDDDAFESKPAKRARIVVKAISLPAASGGAQTAAVEPTSDAAPTPPVVAAGTTIVVADGVTCALGDAEYSDTPIAAAPGRTEVRCKDAAGTAMPPIELQVAAVTAKAELADQPDTATLRRDAMSLVVIELTSEATVDGTFTIAGSEGVDIGVVGRLAGNRIRVPVTVRKDAPDSVILSVLTGPQGRAVELASLTLLVEAPSLRASMDAPIFVAQPRSHLVSFDAFLGLAHIGTDNAINDPNVSGELAGGAGLGGVRASAAVTDRIHAEAEVALASAAPFDPDTSDMVSVRVHGVLMPRVGHDLRPFAMAGVGTRTAFARGEDGGQTEAQLHWGAGLRWNTEERVGLRVDARHILAPGTAGFSHSFELTAGVFVQLGQR